MPDQLNHYKRLWSLIDDGESFDTHSSLLQPVWYNNIPCMLKVALGDEERRGNSLMAWWNGNGAAGVLQHADRALLMERASSESSLDEKRDDDASRIICSVD